MVQKQKSKITVFQLFFLSFSYVFSGFFLVGERAFLSLLLTLAAVLLYAALGYLFTAYAPIRFEEKNRFSSFLSCAGDERPGKLLAAMITFFSAAELLLMLPLFISSVKNFSPFIPVWITALLLIAIVFFISAHGLSVIGRFSETMIFLLIPLFAYLVFRDTHPIDLSAFSKDLRSLFSIMPGPFLFLLSMTVSQSTAMPSPLKKRALVLSSVLFGGAVLAVLAMFLLMLFGTGENNIFMLFLGWATSLVRASLLISLCTVDAKRLCVA